MWNIVCRLISKHPVLASYIIINPFTKTIVGVYKWMHEINTYEYRNHCLLFPLDGATGHRGMKRNRADAGIEVRLFFTVLYCWIKFILLPLLLIGSETYFKVHIWHNLPFPSATARFFCRFWMPNYLPKWHKYFSWPPEVLFTSWMCLNSVTLFRVPIVINVLWCVWNNISINRIAGKIETWVWQKEHVTFICLENNGVKT